MRCSTQNDIINGTKRLAQLEHSSQPWKKPEMRPKECVFDSRNDRIIMEYYNDLFVAYATPKKIVENPVFFVYWVKSRDVCGVRIYPRCGFLRSGSIKSHHYVMFVPADIRSVTIRGFSQQLISDPLRFVTFSWANIHSANNP